MMRRVLIGFGALALVAVTAAACGGDMDRSGSAPPPAQQENTSGMTADGPSVPPVNGFAEGQAIQFIHTEASDPQVAQMLTMMIGSPVTTVPSLADAPKSMVTPVYVFENGVEGHGPFGFQSDVFGDLPGTQGYTPLRVVHLVTWQDEAEARELKAVEEVREAEARGEIAVEETSVVVNMPIVRWPGGER